MKIISILTRLSTTSKTAGRPVGAGVVPEWIRDPLAHPDLDAMSERELADLPFSGFAGRLASLDGMRG